MDRAIVTAVEQALGVGVERGVPLHGGDVAVAYGVALDDGRRVFVKTHRSPPQGFFSTEAAGLAWIREAGTVDVPSVLAVADEAPPLLVLSWIERGTARDVTDQGPRSTTRCPAPSRRTVLRSTRRPHDREPGAAE